MSGGKWSIGRLESLNAFHKKVKAVSLFQDKEICQCTIKKCVCSYSHIPFIYQ